MIRPKLSGSKRKGLALLAAGLAFVLTGAWVNTSSANNPTEDFVGGGEAGGQESAGDPNAKKVEALQKVALGLREVCADRYQKGPGEDELRYFVSDESARDDQDPGSLETALRGEFWAPEDDQGSSDDQVSDDSQVAPRIEQLCESYCSADKGIYFCAFDDEQLASLAFAVAPEDIRVILHELQLLANIGARILARSRPSPDLGTTTTLGTTPGPGASTAPELPPLGEALVNIHTYRGQILKAPSAGGLSLAGLASGVGSELLQRGLGALAQVIVDRAKREAIGWLLDRLGSDLCGERTILGRRELVGAMVDAGAESTRRQLRALPDPELLAQAKQLQAKDSNDPLKAEIEGFEVGVAVQAEIQTHWLPNVCSLAREERLDHFGAGNALLAALRGAFEADVRRWPGVAAGLGLGEFHWHLLESKKHSLALIDCQSSSDEGCKEVDRLRRAGERFIGDLLAGGEPLTALHRLGTSTGAAVVRRTTKDKNLSAKISDPPLALFACGVSMPAEIAHYGPRFGKRPKGQQLAALAGLLHAPACWQLVGEGYPSAGREDVSTKPKVLALSGQKLERLSTVLRLYDTLIAPFDGVAAEIAALQLAGKALADAREAGYDDDADRVAAIWQALTRALSSGLGVADSLFAVIEGAPGLPCELLPGLTKANNNETDLCTYEGFEERVEKLRELVALTREVVDAAGDFGGGDEAEAVVKAARLLFEQLQTARNPAPKSPCSEVCVARLDAIARHIGTIAAILAAKDEEDMAAAIDSAANPPGGWRTKLKKGNVTLSLAAYPGFIAGAEWRWGPYGANYERGRPVYGQAPTLSLPFGLDIVAGLGRSAIGAFVSVIDPAAFLHYDVEADGKLPGPRPVTVLAPGAFVRVNLGPTPLVALAGVVFRPQFRTWEPTVSGPGANVVQVLVGVGVDVTLWRMASRARSPKKKKKEAQQ